MNRLKSLATSHPLLFVLSSIIIWFLLLMVFAGISSGVFRRPFGGAETATIGHLGAVAGVLILLWNLDWLGASGVARLGSWRAWLVALGGLLYFACASLYAFYGSVAFDFSSLSGSAASRTVIVSHLVAGLSEETLFRGLLLYVLIQSWGNTRPGIIGSVVLTSLLFSVLHLIQVFTGVSLRSVVFLTLQTCLIAIWWGALVVWGRSIWPAVMLHSMGNAVVAVQGLSVAMVQPDVLAYRRILWFSIPLCAVGIWIVAKAVSNRFTTPGGSTGLVATPGRQACP